MRNQYTSTFEQDYPCRAQIIRCKADRDAAPMNDYRYPEESGSFTGTLTFRCWHRSKPMLLCFFDAERFLYRDTDLPLLAQEQAHAPVLF